jgi:hypothetical protein
MISFDKSLAKCVAAGRVTPKTAEEWVRDKKTYMDYLSNLKLDNVVQDINENSEDNW